VVSESLCGTGAGLNLLLKAAEYARENNQKILPICPFAKSVFDRREDLSVVLFN
jgi:predicted GNAT family acetyltransferase